MRHFGFEANFSCNLLIEILVIGQPGFDSSPEQPLEQNECLMPLLKGLKCVYLEPNGEKREFIFNCTLCYLKILTSNMMIVWEWVHNSKDISR